MTGQVAFSSDGYAARWITHDAEQIEHVEQLSLQWENEAWTACGHCDRDRIDYVIRLSPLWQVRQFILFRDLEQPDLWLGTDGHGRWGEVNGAHRPDLDGATDLAIADSPFPHTIPIRRLPLAVGDAAELMVLRIDAETLAVQPVVRTYQRIGDRTWRVHESGTTIEFDVDQHGIPLDFGGYRRHD